MTNCWFHKWIAAVLIAASFACQAQSTPLSLKIKAKVEQATPGQRLTVIMLTGPSYHGALSSADAASFNLDDVDEKRIVTLRYDDVKKVQNGYGGYNTVIRRHVNPVRARVVTLLVLTGLILIVAVALANDK